jgi:hypothetical protein
VVPPREVQKSKRTASVGDAVATLRDDLPEVPQGVLRVAEALGGVADEVGVPAGAVGHTVDADVARNLQVEVDVAPEGIGYGVVEQVEDAE